jgi:hypothetical protein
MLSSSIGLGQAGLKPFTIKAGWDKGNSRTYTFDYIFADNRKYKAFLLKYHGDFKVLKKTSTGYQIKFTYRHIPEQKFIFGTIANVSSRMDKTYFIYETDLDGKFLKFIDQKKALSELNKSGISLESSPKDPVTITGGTIELPKGTLDNLEGDLMLGFTLKDIFINTIYQGIRYVHSYYGETIYESPIHHIYPIQNNWDGDSLKATTKQFYIAHENLDQLSVIISSQLADRELAKKEVVNFIDTFCEKERLRVSPGEMYDVLYYKDRKIDFDKKSSWMHMVFYEEKFKTAFAERVERFVIE